jgi:hypothetical protein
MSFVNDFHYFDIARKMHCTLIKMCAMALNINPNHDFKMVYGYS